MATSITLPMTLVGIYICNRLFGELKRDHVQTPDKLDVDGEWIRTAGEAGVNRLDCNVDAYDLTEGGASLQIRIEGGAAA